MAKTNSQVKVMSESLLSVVIEGIQNVKGKEISVIDLSSLENAVAKYFVVCQGDSSTQICAIAKSIESLTKETLNEVSFKSEGLDNAEWVLVDYSNVIVHIFSKTARAYYDIEGLWADAVIQQIENVA